MFKLTSLTSQFNFYINTSGDASICTADLGIVFGGPHGERVALTYPGSRAEPLVRWSVAIFAPNAERLFALSQPEESAK